MEGQFNTLWGNFESDDDGNFQSQVDTTEEVQDQKDNEDQEGEEEEVESAEEEEVEKSDTEESDEEEEEKSEEEVEEKEDTKTEPDTSEIEELFNSVNDFLEGEDLMFLGDDAQYEATSKGLSKMMKDNMEKYKEKLESEFSQREKEIRDEYSRINAPKFRDLDTTNPKHAEHMLKEYLKLTGFEDNEISDRMRELKDMDTVEKEAKIAQRYLTNLERNQEAAQEKLKAKEEKERQAQIEEYINDIKTSIDTTEELAGFKMTGKMRKEFKKYLFEEDKDGKTLAQKASSDPERRLRLAFLDFIDFNKKDFEIKAKTEVSNALNKKTARFTDKNNKIKGKSTVEDEVKEEGFNKGFLNFWGA